MAVTATPVFPQTPNVAVVSITSADGAAATKTIYTGAANCSKVVAVNLTATCTESHLLTLSVTRNSTAYALGAVTVNQSSGYGTDGVAASLDLLRGGPNGIIPSLPVDNDGQKYIFLTSVDTLQITHATSLTSNKKIDIVAWGVDF